LRPDLVITIIVLAVLPLALYKANFPLRLAWASLLATYILIAVQSVAMAGLLWTFHSPQSAMQMAKSYFKNKLKLLVFILFAAGLVLAAGVQVGIYGGVFTLAITEFIRRSRADAQPSWPRIRRLLPAAGYLFLGILLTWIYTSVIVRLRFYAAYDLFFNHLDLLVFRTTVPELVRRVAQVLPEWAFITLNAIYYWMFAQVGATIVICGLSLGRRRAMQFVATVVLAFYMGVIVFSLWPSHGPYYLSAGQHTGLLGGKITSYAAQREFLKAVQYLWGGNAVTEIPLGHYIAFPSLHFALPLIVLWFLRPWRRIVIVLAVYDVFLAVAIILLEWHYFVDLIGGIGVAALAIALAEVPRRSAPGQSGSDETFNLEFPNTGGTL
jgi:hypothetical protein